MNKNNINPNDVSPKRRKADDNPYTIFTKGAGTDDPRYYVSFKDIHGVNICMEIQKSLYELLNGFELEDLSHFNRVDRHYEYKELSEEELYERAFESPEDIFDAVCKKIISEMLYQAINDLPYIQRRRLVLYYFGGLTYEEIAVMESCRHSAVVRSVKNALKKLRKYMADLFDEI